MVLISSAHGRAECVNPSSRDTVVTSIVTCQSYTWSANGETYTSSSQEILIDHNSDCLVEILNLTIVKEEIVSKNVFACSLYHWDKTGETYTSSGIYATHDTTDQGCVVEFQLALTLNDSYHSSRGASYCDDYEWHAFETFGDFEVKETSIDGSGTIVAIGNYALNNQGVVEVYKWDGESGWTQMGQILIDESGGFFGNSISLSKSGTVLAVGAPFANDDGIVKVYKYDGSSWIQMGSTISGQFDFEQFGWDVDLNNDGQVLVIGAPANGDDEVQTGEARVYQWTGADWSQLGDDLWINTDAGNTNPDNNGYSVGISNDGQSVVVGAQNAYSSKWRKYFAGAARVYNWNGSEWELSVDDPGYREDMQIGRSAAISEDGRVYIDGSTSSGFGGSEYSGFSGSISLDYTHKRCNLSMG